MKTNRFYIILAAMVILMTSCNKNDAHLLTIIKESGTCSREMSFHPDSQNVTAPLSEPININGMIFRSGWQRTWSMVDDSIRHACPMTQQQWDSLQNAFLEERVSSKILMHIRQDYPSVHEMGDSLTRVAQDLFKDSVSLEKRFKWFYTDYVYQETLSNAAIDNVSPVSLDRFVSADTASYWFTGQPNLAAGLTGAEQKEMLDDIEAKISHWFNACCMAHICEFIANECYDEVKNPPVSKAQFIALKDSIAMSPAVNKLELFGDIAQFSIVLEDFFHSNAYTPLFEDSKRWDERLEEKYKYYNYFVTMAPTLDYVMPGKVIDAGAGEVDGNVVHYKFSAERLIPHPYDVTITSRVTNVWAFIVTFLIILLAIGSFLYHKKPNHK